MTKRSNVFAETTAFATSLTVQGVVAGARPKCGLKSIVKKVEKELKSLDCKKNSVLRMSRTYSGTLHELTERRECNNPEALMLA